MSRTSRVTFNDGVEVIQISTYASVFGYHPRQFILHGPVGDPTFAFTNDSIDPYTGLSKTAQSLEASRWKPDVAERERVLHETLTEGARWETPVTEMIAALQRKKPNKFVKKRVGCRAAKKAEALDNLGDARTGEQQALYRALAARALYLSLDRPDTMYATKGIVP